MAALRTKVLEEAREVCEASTEELAKEIGDLLEVVEALCAACGLDEEQVERTKVERRLDRGGFERRLRLLWTDDNRPEPGELRAAMFNQPHIKPLTEWIESIRESTGAPKRIPLPDALDGGIEARLLVLLEAPGPKALESGYISMDNPDPTARNLKRFLNDAGIDRKSVLLWNIVPWYLSKDGGRGIRAASREDLEEASKFLDQLLCLLPRVEAVLLLGNKAKRGWGLIGQPFAARVYSTFHPSNRVFSLDMTRIDDVRRVFRSVAQELIHPAVAAVDSSPGSGDKG